MGKIFYTIQEAAEQLGLSEDEIKQLAEDGKLQPYRDRDRLMFKRDEVESLGGGGGGDDDADVLQLSADESALGDVDLSEDTDSMASDAGFGLDLSEDSDVVDLKDETSTEMDSSPKGKTATGISVFDADEIQPVDEGAETVMTTPMSAEEEALIDSVGSGSGLLDLTRESDDTSLGAEIMDDVSMDRGAETVGATVMDEPSSGTSVFDAAGGGSGIGEPPAGVGLDGPVVGETFVMEADDPAADGLALGFLIVAVASLIIAAIVVVTGMSGTLVSLTTMFGESTEKLMIYCGALLGGALVVGIIGWVVGRAVGR